MISSYKHYQRDLRVINTEEIFTSGMAYTDLPLTTGFVKELDNFDIDDSGESIKPRPGLRSYEEASSDAASAYSADSMLLACKLCSEANAQTHGQIITGQVSDNKVTGTDLYKGLCRISTVDETATASAVDASIVHADLLQDQPVTDIATAWTTFKRPGSIEAHGLKVENTSKFARHIGTFGFNNSYYFFIDGDATLRGLYQTHYDTDRYKAQKLTPKLLTPKEAVSWGYNMLLDQPYNFASRVAAVGSVQLLGILPYDDSGNLVSSPRINTQYEFRCFYAAPPTTKYKVVWETKALADTTWAMVKTLDQYAFGTDTTENAEPLKLSFSAPTVNTLIRVTVTAYTTDTTLNTNPDQVMVVSFTMHSIDYKGAVNTPTVKYDLYKCSGMTYWKNRLVCYGFTEDATVLLLSDVNDPTFFPYPNNADVFDEPIVYVVPFLEKLLIFTTTKLYQMNVGTDGTTFYTTEIQRNLKIHDWDIHLTQVIKNMLFFKSGNYYYMIVPKASSATGELTLAPISKNIQSYFDHFAENVQTTVEQVYGYRKTLTLVNYYNYLDYNDIHNIYVFKTDYGYFINLGLLYDSVKRTWRIYLFESQNVLKPYSQDATQKGIMVGLFSLNTKQAFQFLNYSLETAADQYIDLTTGKLRIPVIQNFQFMDSGYRAQSTDFKKRFRELQFKLSNTSMTKLSFYTSFLIDGMARKEYTNYKATLVKDPASPDYGTLILERNLLDPISIKSDTLLADSTEQATGLYTYNDFDHWILDESIFPAVTAWKIRIPVSGKGYQARLKFLSCNPWKYELLSMSWVYRQMYAR